MSLTVLQFIKALRSTDQYIGDIYTRGGCYQFFLLLKKLYPEAVPYINHKKNHVATLINGKLYDICGVVKNQSTWKRLTKRDEQKVMQWSFHKYNCIQIKECPFCEEPITV